MNKIVAIILAGGRSKRFWPLSDKNVLQFTSYNLIEHHLQTLKAAGINNFVIVCSPDALAFLRVNGNKYKSLIIDKVLQDEKKPGIGNAILASSEIIQNKYKNYLVYIVNCDDIYDGSLHNDLINFHKNNNSKVSVAGHKIENYKPLGYFLEASGNVTGIIEKPEEHKVPSLLANMSLHLFSDFALILNSLKIEASKPDQNDDSYERTLNDIMKNHKVSCFIYEGEWKTLKYPWEVLDVMEYLLGKINPSISSKAHIHKSSIIEGNVVIKDNVRVLENTKILGPAVIKEGTIIGTGSMVRGSIINKNCILGFHTEVTRSYIGENCWFHTNFIGDSILGNEVNMGAGGVLANLRFDNKEIISVVNNKPINTHRIKLGSIIGSGAQIGVNSSIMPGVKIGKNTLIGPGVILTRDIPQNSKVFVKQELTSSEINSSTDLQSIRDSFRSKL